MLKNDDAVSISIGFILMFTITVLIFTALIISFYSLSQRSEKVVMWESFKILGEGLAVKITSVDTLVNISNTYGGSVNTITYEFTMPSSIAGKSYTINITNSTGGIIFESDNGARAATPFNISTKNFIGRMIYSGSEDYKIKYDKSNSSISIE